MFNSKGEWQGHWFTASITGAEVRLFRMPEAQFYNYGTRRDGNRGIMTFIRHDAKGARDTVAPPAPPPSAPGVVCQMNGGISFFSSTYEPRRIRVPAPGNSFLDAMSDEYKIAQVNAAGATITTFAGTAPRLPLGDAEWETSIKDWTKFVKEKSAAGCNHGTITRPSAKPAIRAMWWDDGGRLWVERYAANGFAFDVFNAKGAQVATMPAPERESSVEPSVVRNRIALLTVNSDGAHVVRVYTISGLK